MIDAVLYLFIIPVGAFTLGTFVSYLAIRWLPIRVERKRILYCVVVVLLFTPVVIPITAAGAIILPALLLGFTAFPFNLLLNAAFLLASIVVAIWLSCRAFLQPLRGISE
jgi:hypothetical protein